MVNAATNLIGLALNENHLPPAESFLQKTHYILHISQKLLPLGQNILVNYEIPLYPRAR